MVSSIGSSGVAFQPQNSERFNYKLSDEQKETLNSIISKYDIENLDDEGEKQLFDEIKESGIPKSEDVKKALDAAGFQPPPPPDGSAKGAEGNQELPQFILDFISKQESGEVTQDDINTLITNLQNNGQLTTGSLVDKFS